jgi:carotenoid cleavage dioxygenase
VSAHPKVDAKTGDLYVFGYDRMKPVIHFSIIDKDRKVTLSDQQIKITSPRMIHDFMITENYVIFPDLPLELSPPKAVKNKGFIFQFDEKLPSR